MSEPALTLLNLYRLKGTVEQAQAAIGALVARVERDGEGGILAYRFWVCATDGTARAVIDYASGRAWIGHHDLSMGWPEMQALHSVAELVDAIFLGDPGPEVRAWLAASPLRARLHEGFVSAGGFRRA